MNLQNYSTTIQVTQTPTQVFEAINNVRGWWSEQIDGNTDQLNAIFDYHYQDVHICKMEIIAFVPQQKVVWLVKENYFNFIKDQEEWKGTTIQFEIIERSGYTELVFTHFGLNATYECYDICSDAWGNYITVSLKSLIEAGKGNPNPYQEAIDKAAKKEQEASTDSYRISFLLDKAPSTVYHAINDVRGWWGNDVKGPTNELDQKFQITFEDKHYSEHKVIELSPFKRIVWLVTDSKLTFVDSQSEWNGTKNVFDISTEDGKTRLTFTHVGLVPAFTCFNGCSGGWDHFLSNSLVPFILTGKGEPK